MRTRHLLVIVLVIWIPLGYHLLADDALLDEITQLEQQHAPATPSLDNYDINLMAISETEADPVGTLEQVVNYQRPTDAYYESLRLPELEALTKLHSPLLCDLSELACRLDIASKQAEVSALLARYSGLLQQYEALQHLSNIQSMERFNITVDMRSVLSLDQLYALHIYQLMRAGDMQQAESKLIALIKQQRRFLSHAASKFRRSLVIINFFSRYLPLAVELSKHSAGSRTALAGVMQPLTLNEVTGITSNRFEFLQKLTLIRQMGQGAALTEMPYLNYKLLYKPNLTANTLYKLHLLPAIKLLSNKHEWYAFSNAPETSNKYINTNTLAYHLSNYRNLIGGGLATGFTPTSDTFGKDIYSLDLQLHLLQPLLLNGFDNGGLDFASFALNPYNNSSVVNIKGQWCYELEQDICLPEMH